MTTLHDALASDAAVIRQERTHRARRLVPALTGIRGYAAVVVLFHLQFELVANHVIAAPFSVVLTRGYLGVDLFFLLSGYVLQRTYGDEFARAPLAAAGPFAIGRLFRIFPLHWTVMLLFLLVQPPRDTSGWATFWQSMALVQNWTGQVYTWNVPSWSLGTEMLAYLLFPLLALAAARMRNAGLAAAVVLTGIAAYFALSAAKAPFTLDHPGRLGLVRCVLEFSAGMALYRMAQLRTLTARDGTVLLSVAAVLMVIAFIGTLTLGLTLIAFALLILACESPSPLAARVFGNGVARVVGELSFSIYLLHWWLIECALLTAHALAPGDPHTTAVALWSVPIIIGPLAWLTWRWIEKPSQEAGRRIVRRLRARQAA